MPLETLLSQLPNSLQLDPKKQELLKHKGFTKQPSDGKTYFIFRCTTSAPAGEEAYIDFITTTECRLGEGSYGTVYFAAPFNAATNEVDKSHYLAIKIFFSTRDPSAIKSEAEILQTLFGGVHLTSEFHYKSIKKDSQSGYIIAMKYFNGTPLADTDSRITSMLPSERIKLSLQLAKALNKLHKKNILHGDIKSQNILMYFDENKQKFKFVIIDYGLSENVGLRGNQIFQIKHTFGTPITMAPELTDKKTGLKSDIFSLSALIMGILNADNPLRFRKDSKLPDKQIYALPFDYSGLLKGINFPGTDASLIKRLVRAFIKRMSHLTYDERPNAEQIVAFFSLLKDYCAFYSENNISLNVAALNQYRELLLEARLAFMALKLMPDPDAIFQTPATFSVTKYASLRFFKKTISYEVPLVNLQLEDQLPLCAALIASLKNGPISPLTLKLICTQTSDKLSKAIQNAILNLYNRSCLTPTLIDFLMNFNGEFVTQVAEAINSLVDSNVEIKPHIIAVENRLKPFLKLGSSPATLADRAHILQLLQQKTSEYEYEYKPYQLYIF